MKRARAGWLFAGGLALFCSQAALGQEVICCMQLVSVGGDWFGALRTCDLSGVPPGRRASLCQQLAGCADAAPYCGVDRPCTVAGSIVDAQNQALGERIRVGGTPFALHYRSDRIQGGRPNSFPNSLAGWSLSVHHAYDTARKIVYDGEGGRRVAGIPGKQAKDEIRIPSEDGTVVHVFDGKGRHRSTENSATGAVLYRFIYDGAMRLVEIEDGFYNITRIERDAKGVPTAILAPGGQRTALSVAPGGNLASVANPAGETTRLRYSKGGLLSELTDAKDQVHRFAYSSQGALLKDENPAGGHWALARTRTPSGFKVALSSALGRTSTYEIERLPTGEERRLNTGPGGAAIQVETDAAGNDKVTGPDGTVSATEFQPDPRWGGLAPFLKSHSMVTPGGRKLSVSAERKADLHEPVAQRPETQDREPLRALAPLLKGLRLPGLAENVLGSLPERKATPPKPDEPPRLRSLTESFTINGRGHERTYDTDRMEWTLTTPARRQVITRMNAQGRVVGRAVPGTLPVSLAYDDSGRLSSISQGTGAQSRVVTVSHDAEGRVARIIDPLGRSTRFEYDPAGRVTKQVFADGREILYAYDPNGNLAALTPPGRSAHRFEHTAADRVRTYKAPDVSSSRTQTAYAYNPDGQLTRVTRPGDAKPIDVEYDKAGRISALAIAQGKIRYLFDAKTDQLKSITAADGGVLSYEYDGFLLTKATWSGTVKGHVARGYDNDLRISSVTINGGPPIEYRHDPDGLLTRAGALTLERDPRSGAIGATKLGHVTTVHDYDDFGQIRRYAASFKDQEILALEYERDAAGRIVRKTETIEGKSRTFLYGYDLAGRLSEVSSDGARIARYEYDANANRIAHAGRQAETRAAYDAQDRLTTYGGATYRYAANGELAGRKGGGDAAFDYDALGNLRGASLSGGPRIEYVIDGANRRVGKKREGRLVQGFLYADRLKPVAELDGGNKVVGTFVYGAKVNVPEYVEKADGIYRIITDHLGSPRLVVNAESGTVAQKMDYDEFGVVLEDTNPGFQPFGFAGGLYDPHTRLTRFGARDYDAAVGRWTAKDPVRFAAAETNLYAYAYNDPNNFVDFNGLDGKTASTRFWSQGGSTEGRTRGFTYTGSGYAHSPGTDGSVSFGGEGSFEGPLGPGTVNVDFTGGGTFGPEGTQGTFDGRAEYTVPVGYGFDFRGEFYVGGDFSGEGRWGGSSTFGFGRGNTACRVGVGVSGDFSGNATAQTVLQLPF